MNGKCRYSQEVELVGMAPRCSMIFIAPFENDSQALVSHGWTFENSSGRRFIQTSLLRQDGEVIVWEKLRLDGAPPCGRNIPACCSSNYDGYVYGGYEGYSSGEGFYRIVGASRAWQRLPVDQDIGPLAGATLTDIEGSSLILCGGMDTERPLVGKLLWRYNIGNGHWEKLKCELPQCRFNHSCSFVKPSESLLVVGGSEAMEARGFVTQVVQISLKTQSVIRTVSLASIPRGIAFHSAYSLGDSVFLFGGGYTPAHSNPFVIHIDTAAECMTSTRLLAIREAKARYGAGCGCLGSSVIQFGGSHDWEGFHSTLSSARRFQFSIDPAPLFVLCARILTSRQINQLPQHFAEKCWAARGAAVGNE